MNLKIAVIAVSFARQKRFNLSLLRLAAETLKGLFGLGDNIGVVFALTKFDEFEIVVQIALKALEVRKRTLKPLALTHELLCLLRIVPKIGCFGLLV